MVVHRATVEPHGVESLDFGRRDVAECFELAVVVEPADVVDDGAFERVGAAELGPAL
jgi:hypothetical protein